MNDGITILGTLGSARPSMGKRAPDWIKVIRPETEDCYWVAPDGSHHLGTPEENAEVRRELLEMRIIGERRIQEKAWDHL